MGTAIVSLRNITKTYPGVVALDDFSLDFSPGEVHALLGENGAGKSTLIKILAGALEPDSGIIDFGEGRGFHKLTPHAAKVHGVEAIFQEFNLIGCLSAAENICLGERSGRFVDYKWMERRAKEVFDEFNIDIDPKADVDALPSSKQQIVEIAKAVSRNARILIMDEPTAPLSLAEVEHLFRIIAKLKDRGVTVIYISHRMEELFAVADRVTVMRDGKFVKTLNAKETDRKELISLMVGRELKETFPRRASSPGGSMLEARGVTGNGDADISFSVRKGEILGIAGLVGSGRTELARMIFGADPLDSGSLLVKGRPVRIRSPLEAIRQGIGLIPEDRKLHGCLLSLPVKDNITLSCLKRLSKFGVVDVRKERSLAAGFFDRLRIKAPSMEQTVRNLSGGNQQKVVMAKTLATESEILIFDEPTRGIDVGAKQEIYRLMNEFADQGRAIVMISSEMEELIGMSDRIIVLAEGRLTGELPRAEFSQQRILELASLN